MAENHRIPLDATSQQHHDLSEFQPQMTAMAQVNWRASGAFGLEALSHTGTFYEIFAIHAKTPDRHGPGQLQ